MALRNAEKFESDTSTPTSTIDDLTGFAETPAASAPEVKNSIPGSAVAKAASTAVGKAMKFKPALTDFEGAIDPAGMEFGVFPKIIVNLGGFKIDENRPEGMGEKLGGDITIKLLSWNKRWLASPGSDDKEAKDYVKYSTDGVYVQGSGQKMVDYVEQLKTVEGYDQASIKEYIAVWGFLMNAEGKDIPEADQCMVELQCSPQTAGQFKRHQIEHGMKVAKGLIAESDVLKCHAGSKTMNSKDFGYATFTAG